MSRREPERTPSGARIFSRLARGILRHPWYPVVFWVVLLVLVIPFLPLLGSVTTNSTESVPTNSPSAVANAELARLFPNESGGASSILLFVGTNLTDPNGQGVIENVTRTLVSDRSLTDVAHVASVYTSYASYLAGQVRLAAGGIEGAAHASPSLLTSLNQTAALLWGVPSLFLSEWESDANGTSGNASGANFPAYQATLAAGHFNAAQLAVLDAFYSGFNGSVGGFNGTAACAADPVAVVACLDRVVRTQELPLLPSLLPRSGQAVGAAALTGMEVENFSAWPEVRATASTLVAGEVGMPAGWVDTVWAAFPSGSVSASDALAWANGTVSNGTLWTEPLPVPYALPSPFVNAAGTASLISVSFSVTDDYTNSSGGQPVYADLPAIDDRVGPVLADSDATHSIRYYQTGSAPLDLVTNTIVDDSLRLVLPLTVGLLLVISMAYFRSPLTPLMTFAALSIALVLALGGTVLLGVLFGPVDSTSLTLEEVFVLGVGTDYSIFIVARYREELHRGRSSDEAIEQSLAWAGQSVATSGSTAIIATLALTFSGVALLSQWGRVLALAILFTILLSLTLVPAALKLLGPRIFWPDTGRRFDRRAEEVNARTSAGATYFYRAGRLTQRRPATVLGILLLVSIPLVLVALQVPLAYDFYGQLPGGHPATDGLQSLYSHFGDGFAVPSFALVTFASPLVVGNYTNVTEFTDVAHLTSLAENTSGIAVVQSPVGPFGAPLSEWENLSALLPAPQQNLLGLLEGFVGTDGRTVLLSLQPSSTGLSSDAVAAVKSVEGTFANYASSHPDITSVAYGGGAPTIGDLADETATATEILVIAVTIGLLLVLLAVLRSWIIAVMAIATIALSISWAWAVTYLVFQLVLGFPLFFYVRTIMFLLILGLGIDYNIFVLTRVREERVKGASSTAAIVTAIGRTGGIITAAAVILASAFAALLIGEFTLIRAIGFSVAIAVVLDAMVVRTYLVPAALQLVGDRAWSLTGRAPKPPVAAAADAGPTDGVATSPSGSGRAPG
ncbi:MAG: MMPL family transporter [Thermoplasmata archaeon]